MRQPRFRRSLVFALWAVAVFGFYHFAVEQELTELRQAWHRERGLRDEIEALRQENAHIEKVIEELGPGGAEIERIARQELGWANDGEIVVKIPEKR